MPLLAVSISNMNQCTPLQVQDTVIEINKLNQTGIIQLNSQRKQRFEQNKNRNST